MKKNDCNNEKIFTDLCCQVSNHLKVSMPSRKRTLYGQKNVNGNDTGSRVYSVVKVSRNTCYTFFKAVSHTVQKLRVIFNKLLDSFDCFLSLHDKHTYIKNLK